MIVFMDETKYSIIKRKYMCQNSNVGYNYGMKF